VPGSSDQGVHGEQPAILIDHICCKMLCYNVIMRPGICAVYRKQVPIRLLSIPLKAPSARVCATSLGYLINVPSLSSIGMKLIAR
jgi:hypothetical protein